MNRVVVTGLGVVSAAGHGVDSFGAALRAGQSGIRAVAPDVGLPVAAGALLSDLDFTQALQRLGDISDGLLRSARGMAHRAPLTVQTSVLSAIEAWQNAQLATQPADPGRISLVVAGQNLNQRHTFATQQKHQDRLDYIPPSYGIHFLDTDHVGVLSDLLEIRGEGQTVGGASASGNVGLIHGYRLVQWGIADVCVVDGALMDLSPLELQALAGLGALGGKGDQPAVHVCRPFDQQRDGFVYGQGSGCLILENEASARQRGVRPLAELAGYGLLLDGNRLTDPNVAGEARAMGQALASARLLPDDVDYINAHGTSSVLGDATEVAAIKEVFGGNRDRIWLNSTKSLTGHCLTAAGTIEAIAAIVQINGGFVHPNLNLRQPIDDRCRFVGTQSQPAAIQVALSNSFGFSGINSSIVLKRWNG